MTRIALVRLEPGSLERLRSVLQASPFKPYAYLREMDEEVLSAAFLRRLTMAVQDPLSTLLMAELGGVVKGFALMRRLKWDSEIFGFGCARVEYLVAPGEYGEALRVKEALLQGILDQCRAEGIVNLHARFDLEDLSSLHALEGIGFRLIVVLVRYYREAKVAIPRWTVSQGIRPARPGDVEEVKAIARQAFGLNRFSRDPRFPRNRVEELYARWVEDACLGRVSDQVLVAERNGRIGGFLVYGLEEELNRDLPVKLGSFRIAAVLPAYQGQGIYSAFTETALEWFSERVDLIEGVMALTNEAIIRAMSKYGFRYRAACADFHCWLK